MYEWPSCGRALPEFVGEFQAGFRADADRLGYLDWLRLPDGFVCPRCGHHAGWALADGRYKCAGCEARNSATAGTILDRTRTRTPLTVWFTAVWLFATSKDGVSGQSVQRSLQSGPYQTAWAMLHRLR